MYVRTAGQYILKEKLQRGNEFMTKKQRDKCHAIIHATSVTAAGVCAGVAQIPGGDHFALIPIQLAMVVALGGVFGIDREESVALAGIGSGAATVTGRIASTFGKSAVKNVGKATTKEFAKRIPIIGNVLNATIAVTLTETMGWQIAEQFANKADA